MDTQSVACQCGTRLKIPSTLTAAAAVKCPKCGAVVSLEKSTDSSPVPSGSQSPSKPSLQTFDEPVNDTKAADTPGYDLSDSTKSHPAISRVSPQSDMPTATAPASQTCPFCAEIILASAIKCRHCGEFLEASEKRAQIKRPLPKGLVDEPNAAEYFVALIIAPIGLIIGAVWALQRQAKAKRMLQASILSCVILSVGALMLRAYVWKDSSEEDGPSIPANAPVAPNNYYVVVPQTDEDEGPTPRPAPRQGSSSSEMAGLVNLEGQPEHVQRAMRANVRIEMEREQSMGSGVVLQREDDDVLILTNRHVIDATQTPKPPDLRGLPKPRITYYDDQSNRGTVVWIAPDGIDLALVRVRAPKDIDAVGWTVAPKVLAGQEVFAVGNPVGLGWTYTKGVVSALRQRNANGREIPVIQTDTSITYGNSGGGLYSLAGELIGINSSIADPRLGGGLGFAIRPQILIDLKPPGLKLPEETPPHN